MLDPQRRATLTEQLAPPPGFVLRHAVGTTFTLDLETALTVPLSFAAGAATDDPDVLGILGALRRSADRIDVFAQAGAVSLRSRSDLVALLEEMVHPVAVPRGLFHPKVWFLEYARGDERAFRFVCLSRNLTADRSWDVVVRLDGSRADASQRDAALARNAPLTALLRRLPRLAVIPLGDARRRRVDELAAAFATVAWEPPAGFRNLAFHVLGERGAELPPLRGKRALIVSPFVSDDGLAALRRDIRAETVLVSRAETLDRLSPKAAGGRLQSHVLEDTALLDDEDDRPHAGHLVGLHAKVIVVDRQEGARILLGSANATGAALRDNVEVMVELQGPYQHVGVGPTLAALSRLLEPYPLGAAAAEVDDDAATRALERALRSLASRPMAVRVIPDDPYRLAVWCDDPADAVVAGADIRWHLLTRPDLGGRAMPGAADAPTELAGLALTDITPFVVLIASDAAGNERRTVVLARLLDDVDTRRDAVIARQLTDRAAFLRFLAMLLDLSGAAGSGAGAGGGWGAFDAGPGGEAGIFESLVRAVGSRSDGLAEVRRVVEQLVRTQEGAAVLPDGFLELWTAVWAAHEQLTGARS